MAQDGSRGSHTEAGRAEEDVLETNRPYYRRLSSGIDGYPGEYPGDFFLKSE